MNGTKRLTFLCDIYLRMYIRRANREDRSSARTIGHARAARVPEKAQRTISTLCVSTTIHVFCHEGYTWFKCKVKLHLFFQLMHKLRIRKRARNNLWSTWSRILTKVWHVLITCLHQWIALELSLIYSAINRFINRRQF